jgi:hypothetical protein
MDPLLELIERIGTDNPPTDDELATARGELVELLTEAASGDTPDLEAARTLRGELDKIDKEVAARVAAEAADQAEAAELLEGIVTADDGEGEEGEGDDGEGAEGDPESEATETPEAVAASIGRAIRDARARVQANATPPPENPHVRIRALSTAQGEEVNSQTTLAEVGGIFSRNAPAVRNGKHSLVRLEFDYPEDRVLGNQLEESTRLLDAVSAPRAVAAAGGICAPLPADFSHPVVGDRGRPIRDAFPRYGADRGGVRYAPAVTFSALDGGITLWPIETDESPGENTKECLVIDCEDELTVKVGAVVACVQIGNLAARFSPEFWRSRLDALMIAHDRIADQTLYATLDAAATQVTYGAGNGTIYSVLSGLDKLVAGIRSRFRYEGTIRTLGPAWVRNALRADIASQRLGSSPAEALTVADGIIDSFFTTRGVSPVWSLDLDVFGAQGAGALVDFPGANAEIQVWTEGNYFFVDGGTLDLGTEIVDSTLNQTNDRQAFLETFENLASRGTPSYALTVPVAELCVCPDVAAAESPA